MTEDQFRAFMEADREVSWTGDSSICIECGKPKSDESNHVKYGCDLDNPVKHWFRPKEVVVTVGDVQDELSRLRAFVGSFPETADGVMIMPNMPVWVKRGDVLYEGRLTPGDSYILIEGSGAATYSYLPNEVYSTKEAAEAASKDQANRRKKQLDGLVDKIRRA